VKECPILAPNTVFRLRNVVKKSNHFFGIQNGTSMGCQKGDVSPSVWGLKGGEVPLIAKKILDM
jgi:hypothetical protein